MTTRKFVRRVMLTAAVSTVSVMSTVDSDLFGFESAAETTASGIQLVQYQAGQAGGQPNSAVTQELNRLFQESGQPMPSMNPADLPNAQGQNSNMVRPKPQTTMQQPAKKNFLQNFIGKITGQDKKAADSRAMPPVPPEYHPPVPGGHSAAAPVQTGQNQNLQPGMQGQQVMTQPGSQPLANGFTAQPGMRQGSIAPLRRAQAVPYSGQAPRMNQPGHPGSALPTANQPGTTSSVPQQVARGTQQYVQPGTAPAFMPSAQVAYPGIQGAAQSRVPTAPVSGGEPLPAPPVDDNFSDPFTDSGLESETGELLDLESLMESPGSAAAASESASEVVQEAKPARSFAGAPADVRPESAFTQDGVTPDRGGEELSPFTGVRLNETDDEMFDPGLAESAADGTGSGSTTIDRAEETTETFGAPVPPMEDFETNLPAINLPTVDEIPADSVSRSAVTPDAEEQEADSGSPAAEIESGSKSNSNPAASSESNAASPADVTKSKTASLRRVDAERLQQAQEQDRRIRQQRLILSRAGQTGFKGFCPVELRDRRELVDVNPDLTTTFGLQIYTFSSTECRAAFEADPSRYAPAAGGCDVVLLVNSGEEQPGMLDYALWYRDRLYMFRSRETMAMFNQDPVRFANQY